MLVPFLIYCLYNFVTLKDQIVDYKEPQNESDLFVVLMNQTGKTICDYQFQEIPREITFNHYKSNIPETDRDIVTWEKYKFIVAYLNWFDGKNHFDKAKMEDFFCKGALASNMAELMKKQENIEPAKAVEAPDTVTPGRELLSFYK